MFAIGDVVRVSVSFSEDRHASKLRRAIVLQQEGSLVQLLWATTQEVDASAPRAWEFCVTEKAEMAAMGHNKPARYTFRRGGVIVVKDVDIQAKVGECPKSVICRLARAARNS